MNIQHAIVDIVATEDLLERALKLSGLVPTLFARVGFNLVVVGGPSVEFYTEEGYMDPSMDWAEVDRLANLKDFKISQELKYLRKAFGGKRVPDFSASRSEPNAASVEANPN